MAIEPNFESIIVKGENKVYTERIKAEAKTELSSQDVKKVLSLSARVFGVEKELTETGIKYGGKIVFYFCYIHQDGSVRKVECANEFVGVKGIDDVDKNSAVFVLVSPDKTEWDVSGLSVSFTATLEVKIEVENCKVKPMLVGGNGLVLDKKEVQYFKGYGVKKTVCPVECEFELNYPVLEVLSQKVEVAVTQVQAGVNCIIVDGEVFLSALLLQNREKSDIIREDKSTAFRLEIDCEDAMPKMSADAKAFVKSFKTEVSVDAESEKSTVNFTVSLELEGECCSVESVTVASDVFSLTSELETKRDSFSCLRKESVASLPCKISGRCVSEELPVSARITCASNERVEITNISTANEEVKIEGVLSMRVFFKDGDGLEFTKLLETPFERSLPINCDNTCLPELSLAISKVGAKIVAQNEIEIFADTSVGVKKVVKSFGEFVSEITALAEKQECDKAISVYLAGKGEDLWSLAKRLNVCPDELAVNNKDLQFPLTGDERIVVYRKA